MDKKRRISWKRLLKRHGPGFFSWLDSSRSRSIAFDALATALEEYLKSVLVDPATCRLFWEAIPHVRAGCDISDTYERPLAAEAYAYVHLLERYRRFWDVLLHITHSAVLPMSDGGVSVMDVGTGPAPALYAVNDFYRLLIEYATLSDIRGLVTPPPRLECIENSSSMVRFCHRFSELCQRSGPFAPTFSDFEGVDFRKLRDRRRSWLWRAAYYNHETGEYEDAYTPSEIREYTRDLFRYRLIIFSNFLTLSEKVDHFRDEIEATFRNLRPGGVIIVVGAYGQKYREIYARVEDIASSSWVKRIGWVEERLGEGSWLQFATRMKSFHYAVYQHVAQLCEPDTLQKEGYPDYWDPKPSNKFRPKFGLRVFRKGRL
jgi:hypothetical protein